MVYPSVLDNLSKTTKRDLVLEASLLRELARTANLELVVVGPDDVDVGETGDFTRWTTDTTADVKNTHARSETHLGSEVVFVAREGSGERFALVESREVE